MAEGILRKKLQDAGLHDKVEVDSCATGAWHIGDPADDRTERVLADHNASFDHAARKISKSDFDHNYIFAMDETHLEHLRDMFPSHPNLLLVLSLIGGGEVPDPYYGDIRDFQKVYDMLDLALEAFVSKLVSTQTVSQ